MLRTTLTALWSRKRRLLSTGIAIVLGVSFLTATLVLGDSARAGFAAAFGDANEGIDTFVRSEREFSADEEAVRSPLPESVLDTITELDIVDAAVGTIEGTAQILDSDGDPIGGGGPPTFGANWVDDPRLTGWDLAEGRAPTAADEVVIDRASFEAADAELGQPVTVLAPDPIEVTVVGVASFGDDDSIGGTTFVGFTDDRARDLFLDDGHLSTITVAGVDGTTQAEVTAAVRAAVPDGVSAITGDERTAEQEAEIEGDFLGFFTTALTVFAGIALLVAAFSIYNTFSIIVAQRARESALLRAIGASRRQVLTSTLLESLLVGALAAVIGAGVGVALGSALLAGMDAAGLGLPVDDASISAGGLAIAVGAGITITVIGGLAPAWRASAIPPIAALRDVAVDDSDTSRVRIVLGGAVAATGAALLLAAGGTMAIAAAGAVALLIGVLLLGPVVARPVAGLLGRPLQLRGIPGDLARRNAIRNPRRTASTAAALLIGVGIVSLFTIFGASMRASIEGEVDRVFAGDLIVTSGGFGGTDVTAELVERIESTDGVAGVAGIGGGPATVDGRQELVTYTSPSDFGRLAHVDITAGDLADVGDEEVALSTGYAADHDYRLGDTVSVGFVDGSVVDVEVAAVYETDTLSGPVLIDASTWSAHNAQTPFFLAMVGADDGVAAEELRPGLQDALDGRGGLEVMDRDEYIEASAGEIDALLNVIYGLLAMAIVIALMGIANTMSLSIHERIRELGLLRAIGLSRAQLRSTVRWESMLVSTFGAVGGIGLGGFLSWGLVNALIEAEGFGTYDVPVGQLGVILVVGAVVGLVAGIGPARRASRLDVLDALAAE